MSRKYWHWLVILVLATASMADTNSVLGMAAVGGSSHVSALARIGLELQARGHNFAVLVSSKDMISKARLAKGPFRSIRQVEFNGPERIGTEISLTAVDRDPKKVSYLTVPARAALECRMYRSRLIQTDVRSPPENTN